VVHEQALPQTQTQVPPVESSPFFTKPQTQSPSKKTASPNETANLDSVISQLPLVQSLRQSRKTYKESRPHLAIPPAIRQHHFVGGSLAGIGKLALAPYMWTSSRKTQTESGDTAHVSSVVSVFHIGRDLCGHPGFVHGGLLSVLFDEVFARCVSAAFPSGLGMTANLNVDFRKPALPDRVYVLRAETTKIEGRKAWVEGKMTYLPLPLSAPLDAKSLVPDVELLSEDNEGAVMVSEARALFVEPKFADVSVLLLMD
jgi:acyl-coenzyme A thioesterase PaaI-like protein